MDISWEMTVLVFWRPKTSTFHPISWDFGTRFFPYFVFCSIWTYQKSVLWWFWAFWAKPDQNHVIHYPNKTIRSILLILWRWMTLPWNVLTHWKLRKVLTSVPNTIRVGKLIWFPFDASVVCDKVKHDIPSNILPVVWQSKCLTKCFVRSQAVWQLIRDGDVTAKWPHRWRYWSVTSSVTPRSTALDFFHMIF